MKMSLLIATINFREHRRDNIKKGQSREIGNKT